MSYAPHGSPGSLPSDYAILSHFASSALPNNAENSQEDNDEYTGSIDSDTIRPRPRRPRSFSSPYNRPLHPSMGPLPVRDGPVPPTETTPLIGPLVPRIEESIDRNNDNNINTITIFWEELRILAKYTLPVFGTHIFEYSLVFASVISIGHLSTTALAAITLGSMTASVSGFSILQGFVSAMDTMLPSAWTSTQPHMVGLWSQRMAVVLSVSLIPMFSIWFNAESILLSLRQEPEVARLAAVYLRWVSLGLPAYAFNCLSRRYFQSQGLFAVPTRIIMVVAPLNALLNYLLVWGPPSIRLGFVGAPIATAISFNLVSLMSVVYGVAFVPKTAWHPICRRSFTNLGILVRLGLAGVGQTASEWWSWELIGLAASLLGPVALATQSVLLVSASITFQAPFALGVACSVRIGNLLGEHNARRAGVAANTSIVLALAMSGISCSLFLVFKNSWARMFNNDPQVVTLVASILPIVALFQVFDGTAAVAGGVFRARGKQFTSALLNLSAYYVLGLPFGIWLTFERGLGLHGLWIGLTVSLVYCATFGVSMCLRTDWNVEVDKVIARLEAESKDGGNAENRQDYSRT